MNKRNEGASQCPYRMDASQIAALLRDPEAVRVLLPVIRAAEERRAKIASPFTDLRVHQLHRPIVDRILKRG